MKNPLRSAAATPPATSKSNAAPNDFHAPTGVGESASHVRARPTGLGRGPLRSFIDSQVAVSSYIDRLLPEDYRIDGNSEFFNRFVRPALRPNTTVYDVGGGKSPCIAPALKSELDLRIVGLDISEGELARAPAGSYDDTVCADITRYLGHGDADLVICQTLLEHVPDTACAFRAISTMLKPGGLAVLFVPSRKALFARLNRLLPEPIKRRLLYSIFPHSAKGQGFKSYYDRCTPSDFRALAAAHRLEVRDSAYYWKSSYFSFFSPLYLT